MKEISWYGMENIRIDNSSVNKRNKQCQKFEEEERRYLKAVSLEL